MRERHLIDERFKTLSEAEATPPREVRDALASKLGWDAPEQSAGGLLQWLIPTAGLALLLITAVMVFPPKAEVASSGKVTNTRVGIDHVRTSPSTTIAPSPQVRNDTGLATPFLAQIDPNTATTNDQVPSTASAPDRQGTRSQDRSASTSTTSSPVMPGSAEGSESTRPGSGPGRVRATSNEETFVVPLMRDHNIVKPYARPPMPAHHATSTDVAPVWMDLHTITMDRGSTSTLRHTATSPSYVLPPSQWFVGLAIAYGQLKGAWPDKDGLGLNDAEQWRGSTVWGVNIGREWRSGWSIRTGLGLALDRSTLAVDRREVERFTEVDTSWTQSAYNNTSDLVYTWRIDTVAVERPGTTATFRSNNQYGALRIPLTVGWHTDLRRWRLGACAGVAAMIPSQRKGHTIYRPSSDADPILVDLTDDRVASRSTARVDMHLGLSLGFHITEHMTVLLEPRTIFPMTDLGRSETLSMRGQLLQLRLQHVLRTTVH